MVLSLERKFFKELMLFKFDLTIFFTKNLFFLKIIGLLSLLLASLCVQVKIPGFSLAIHNFLIPIIATIIIYLNWSKNFISRYWKTFFLIFAFIAWCWISFYYSEHPDLALIYTIKYFYYIFIFFALLAMTKDGENYLKLCNLVIGFLSIISFLGIIEYLLPNWWIFELFKEEDFYPRISSIMQNPNSFGVLLAIAIILNFLVFQDSNGKKVYFLISEFVFLISLVLSGSRNAWMSLILGFALLILFKIVKLRKIVIFLGVFILTILLFPVAKYRFGLGELEIMPAINIELPSPKGTALSRFLLWKLAIVEIIKHPVTGLGIGVFSEKVSIQAFGKNGFNVHNLFLNILVDLGIPGLLLFFVGAIQLFKKAGHSEYWIIIPLIMFFCSQLVDFFIYDLTFMTIELLFICLAINYQNNSSVQSS